MYKCSQGFEISNIQLPIYTYFDKNLYQQELQSIFTKSPKYVGHELMIPKVGNYYTLLQEHKGKVLVRTEKGINLISNVCRHRQAIILQGQGTTNNIVCPLHLWTYSNTGKLISAPHFNKNPCLNLENYPLNSWKGMLFEGETKHKILHDLNNITQQFQPLNNFNFDNYIFHSSKIHECNYNWKTFIEVYLEDYHVNSFHPGLGNFVNCNNLVWFFGEDYSIQTVGIKDALRISGSKIYQEWQKQILKYAQHEKSLPIYGAIWLTYYPHIMVEWYPFCLVISTLYPLENNKTINIVEFYYPEEVALFEPQLVEAQQAAYMETCREDDEIALRMDNGRFALYKRQDNEFGPYQSPMEDGVQHFHTWYRNNINASVKC